MLPSSHSASHLEPWPFPFPVPNILSACLYYPTLSLILPENGVLIKQHTTVCISIKDSQHVDGVFHVWVGLMEFVPHLSSKYLQCLSYSYLSLLNSATCQYSRIAAIVFIVLMKKIFLYDRFPQWWWDFETDWMKQKHLNIWNWFVLYCVSCANQNIWIQQHIQQHSFILFSFYK